MFEKEAEERITEQFGTSGEYVTRQRIWQDGAEFGYNKANEWHKADVPTNPRDKVVLGYIKDVFNEKKLCLVKWNGEWWYDARTWGDSVELIAWKEIVLPELPKEIE